MGDYKKLQVWEKAHAMAIHAHRIGMRMRGSVHIALRNQLVRAAMSVPANIVEGRAKPSDDDFRRFLGYAIGSLSELEYHLLVGHDLGAIADPDYTSLRSEVIRVRKMTFALIKRLQPKADGQSSPRP